ncbi:MAG: CopD family protein [Aquidulcibacter sp.]|jgi:putative copper export protein|uniref:CopD family protein n=1 Tax=Aquidulcibacter sp. TaxID=2052990 RepID=UPI0022CAF3EB|nr:CopD family protein [Aquidulcibacter sp.]MCE2889875.1 CopD family protein [Hyphomonadaceae bacterium]MCZ8208008.1 CopD family protein [Aquidulcibacter sp.]
MLALDGLGVAGLFVKAAWVVTGLWAIGLSMQAACGVISAREASLRRSILVAATALAVAVATRFGMSAVELAGGLDGAIGLAGLVFEIKQNSIFSSATACCLLAAGAAFRSRLLLACGAILAALAFGLTGHARSHDMPWLAAGIVGLHVVLAGFWASAPLTLWPINSLSSVELAARNRRFGQVAIIAVPGLMIAGAGLAWLFGGGVEGLTRSAYGTMIAIKAICAIVALCLGAWNRLALAEALETEPSRAQPLLARAMALDAALFAAAILAVVFATTIAAPAS